MKCRVAVAHGLFAIGQVASGEHVVEMAKQPARTGELVVRRCLLVFENLSSHEGHHLATFLIDTQEAGRSIDTPRLQESQHVTNETRVAVRPDEQRARRARPTSQASFSERRAAMCREESLVCAMTSVGTAAVATSTAGNAVTRLLGLVGRDYSERPWVVCSWSLI